MTPEPETEEPTNEYTYQLDVDGRGSVLGTALYTIRVVEGGEYENRITENRFRITDLNPENGNVSIKRTGWHGKSGNIPPGWAKETLDDASDLGVLRELGDTPKAVIEKKEVVWTCRECRTRNYEEESETCHECSTPRPEEVGGS